MSCSRGAEARSFEEVLGTGQNRPELVTRLAKVSGDADCDRPRNLM
jgi:hypothetical protein